jgi:hypothetical protein
MNKNLISNVCDLIGWNVLNRHKSWFQLACLECDSSDEKCWLSAWLLWVNCVKKKVWISMAGWNGMRMAHGKFEMTGGNYRRKRKKMGNFLSCLIGLKHGIILLLSHLRFSLAA